MSNFADLQNRLQAYQAAELRILQSQEYSVGQGGAARKNRRAELETVAAQIKALQSEIDAHPDNAARRNVRRMRYLRAGG